MQLLATKIVRLCQVEDKKVGEFLNNVIEFLLEEKSLFRSY